MRRGAWWDCFIGGALAVGFAAFPGVAWAQASTSSCDQTCQVIQKVLDERSDNFANLRAKALGTSGGMWKANLVLAGLDCNITSWDSPVAHYDYSCHTRDSGKGATKSEAQETFRKVMLAFHKFVPDWKWFKGDDFGQDLQSGADAFVGGPADGNYLAEVHFLPTNNLRIDVHSVPLDNHLTLEPYKN